MESQPFDQNLGYKLEVPIPNLNDRRCKDGIGTGNSYLIEDVLSEKESQNIFRNIDNEIKWGEMSHKGGLVPRLVCNQGSIYCNSNATELHSSSDTFIPVYRHPAANPPPLIAWTAHVSKVKEIAEQICGHPLNHALIQLYRSGDDYISEHADKTLDIMEGSYICNYSCGAKRTMILRAKKGARGHNRKNNLIHSDESIKDDCNLSKKEKKEIENKLEEDRKNLRIPMHHNSLFLLDPHTNRYMLHSIKRDKRPLCEKSKEELREGGARISITFRWIHTFERQSDGLLFGGGSRRKEVKVNEEKCQISIDCSDGPFKNDSYDNDATDIKEDGEEMLIGFSKENTEADTFDWCKVYGSGFDAKEAPNFI